jgi:hypothetical protein
VGIPEPASSLSKKRESMTRNNAARRGAVEGKTGGRMNAAAAPRYVSVFDCGLTISTGRPFSTGC